MKKTWVSALSLVLVMLAAISVQADSVTVDSEGTYDGAVQVDGATVWDTQNLNAGNEDMYLGCLTAGVIKFQLPTLPEDVVIDNITLFLTSDGRDIGTSLGLKAGDSNYPTGPFFQLQHYTYDNNGVLCANDATDTRVVNVGNINVATPWGVVSLDVTNAVYADLEADYTYTSFRIQATDYTGRLLTTSDLTAFNGYLASFFGAGSGAYKPYLQIDYSSTSTIDVSAGQLQGIWPDTVHPLTQGGYDFVRAVNNDSENKSYELMLLDIGSAQFVSSFTMTNLLDSGTLFNVAQLEVYAAPQEGEAGFDPLTASNYTTCVFSGIPTPDSYLVGVERTIPVNTTKRYFLFKIVSSYRAYYGFADLTTFADFADLAFVSQTDVCAGKICGLDGDIVEPVTENDYKCFRAHNRDYPNKTDERLLLDMGEIRKVTSLMIANRCDGDSSYNVGQVEVYIAPDETAEGFDPFSSSSYTQCVFNGLPLPANDDQAERRILDITDSVRQYFMIKIVSNFQSYNGTGNNEYADFDDIRATPEMLAGWYETACDPVGFIDEIAVNGANVIMTYVTGATDEQITAFLDRAYLRGMKVILELRRADVLNGNITALTDYIKAYRGHSALYGWSIMDEPSPSQYQICKTAYDLIRLNSSKTAFICFCANDDNPLNFADAYDVFVYDYYPCITGESEFTDFDTFKALIDLVSSKAEQVGKSWWPVLQGIGQYSEIVWDFRLPTFDESRFMTYYCIEKNARGYLNFYYPFCRMGLAVPSDPYPDSGLAWLTDVSQEIFNEINTLASALAAGRLSDSQISDNCSWVNSSLWQDPITGEYYLIAVNSSTTTGNVSFTLTLPGLGLSGVQSLFEGRGSVSFAGNSFADSFSQYQVHVYELTFETVALIPGDATGDGMVDVGDLGVLAANYGQSGKNWADGDFTGDGTVDVGDLGILAANYGTGTSGVNFDADYVKVFGGAVEEGNVEESDDRSLCSTLGLPLIVGLVMIGLMLVKLED